MMCLLGSARRAAAGRASQAGWTLVELGIVFVVVAVIVGAVAPKMLGFMEKAQAEATEDELMSLADVVNAYGWNALGDEDIELAFNVPSTDGTTVTVEHKPDNSVGAAPPVITDGLKVLIPGFDGLSPFKQVYQAMLDSPGPDSLETPAVIIATCVPAEQFNPTIWQPKNYAINLDTDGQDCGDGWYVLRYTSRLLPPGLVADNLAEKEQTFHGFPYPPASFWPGGAAPTPKPPSAGK